MTAFTAKTEKCSSSGCHMNSGIVTMLLTMQRGAGLLTASASDTSLAILSGSVKMLLTMQRRVRLLTASPSDTPLSILTVLLLSKKEALIGTCHRRTLPVAGRKLLATLSAYNLASNACPCIVITIIINLHSLAGDDMGLTDTAGHALSIQPQMPAPAPYLKSLKGDRRIVNHCLCGWNHGAMMLNCCIQAASLRVSNQL